MSSSGEPGNAHSVVARLSDDGRFVLFASGASNLVAGDTAGSYDFFVRDLVARTTTRVSLASLGEEVPGPGSISSDGRYVAFSSDANELNAGETSGRYHVFLHSRLTHSTILVSVSATGEQGNNGSYSPSLSADGKLVAFRSDATNLVSGDTNGQADIFVFERP